MINRVSKPKTTAVVVIIMAGIFGGVSENLRVTVKQGSLIGAEKKNRLTKEPYYAFLGIPYARPPIGVLRFKDPEEPRPWIGVLNATQEGSDCISYNIMTGRIKGEEDCLILNVYTSKKPEDLVDSPRPVMVWIHGGGYMAGSGSPSKFGPDILMRHDIVLVSINYRLSVFGFFSVQNELVPGNAGLKDQVMALKWVKENIAAFGGDPNSVTVFGQSAGAVSVHYLMLSPSARGLFHRAISQSGVALNPWGSTRHIRQTAFNLGEVFGCDTDDDHELVDCLQQVDAKDLVFHQYKIVSLTNAEFLTENLNLPCLEPKHLKNAFLTEHPIKILEAGNFTDVPYLLGVMKVEGLVVEKKDVPKILRRFILDQVNLKPEFILPQNGAPENSTVGAVQKMKQFYFQNKIISSETLDNLTNLINDGWFIYGIHETAMLHSKNGNSPVYLYHFVLETDYAESQKFIKTTRTGASHADDLSYFFYQEDTEISAEEMELISKIIKLWINFAKFGDPTPDKNTSEVIWQAFTPEEKQYLEIGDKFIMKTDLREEAMQFWKNLTEAGELSFL